MMTGGTERFGFVAHLVFPDRFAGGRFQSGDEPASGAAFVAGDRGDENAEPSPAY
jgi:hypothetical protein